MSLDAMVKDLQRDSLCQSHRMHEAKINIDFYNGDFDEHWCPSIEGELHPYRTSMFMKACVDGISNLYKYTPNRVIEGSEYGTDWYQKVMKTNHMAAKMLKAERLAAVSGFAGLCVSGTDDPENPIKITLWSAESLCLFFDPNDATKVVGVIACDKVNSRERFTLWTADRYQVYLGKDPESKIESKIESRLLVEDGENPYGVLPWVFVSHNTQVLNFFAGCPGTHLRKANAYINSRLTKMGQACRFQMEPIGIATNVDPAYKMPKVAPGEFINLPANANEIGGDKSSTFEYVAPPEFVTSAWLDLQSYIDHTMQSLGIPGSATEMLGGVARTGISIVMEQWPLVSASRAKQPQWKEYEYNLAKTVFQVASAWMNLNKISDEIIDQLAQNLSLSVTYNETFVAEAPGQERDRSDSEALAMGMKSKIQIFQERTGASREQAIAHFKQVLEDNTVLNLLEKEYGVIDESGTAGSQDSGTADSGTADNGDSTGSQDGETTLAEETDETDY